MNDYVTDFDVDDDGPGPLEIACNILEAWLEDGERPAEISILNTARILGTHLFKHTDARLAELAREAADELEVISSVSAEEGLAVTGAA
jgi:hypothetical protein